MKRNAAFTIIAAILLTVSLASCSNKEIAIQIMNEVQSKPPKKSETTFKDGRVKVEFYDSTPIRLALAQALMVNDALEWTKAILPAVASLGGTWVSQYYSTQRNEDNQVTLQSAFKAAGDSYSAGGNIVTIDKGGTYNDKEAEEEE